MVRLFLYELRSNIKSLLIWTVILALLFIMALAKFEGYSKSPELLQVLEKMPKALLDAFNMRAFNLTTLEGFLGIMATYYYLMVGIAAVMWSANGIAKEEYNRTADFTFVLPLSRSQIFVAKALSSLITSVLFVLLSWGINLFGAQYYHPEPKFYTFLHLVTVGMLFIALLGWAVGIAFACIGRHSQKASWKGIFVILITYMLSILPSLNERLKFLKWFTPFQYFNPVDLHQNGSVEGIYVGISLFVAGVLVFVSHWSFSRRDISF